MYLSVMYLQVPLSPRGVLQLEPYLSKTLLTFKTKNFCLYSITLNKFRGSGGNISVTAAFSKNLSIFFKIITA